MRITLLPLIFLLTISTLFAQPANDECETLIDLGEIPICPVPEVFTNVNATQSSISADPSINIPTCFNGGAPDRDVWFKFTVPADGSLLEVVIEVRPIDGPNGAISQPQIAAYRGECGMDEMFELSCAVSELGEDMVELPLVGLDADTEIFLRIQDWSASASPNWGDFELCLKEPEQVFNIGDAPGAMTCSGTLFDTGGPDGNYGNNENEVFTICPSDDFTCIEIDILESNLENTYEFLSFYGGSDINAPQIISFTGNSGATTLVSDSDCVTVQFTSDGSVTNPGFELNWQCTNGACESPIITCGNAIPVDDLPFSQNDLSTCGTSNAVNFGPCGFGLPLGGEDYILEYNSPGDECISINIGGSNPGTGVSVYDACPELANDCLGSAVSLIGDLNLNSVFLSEPGQYTIVIDNPSGCTDFDIEIIRLPACTNITCDNPNEIDALPFLDSQTTCGAVNSVTSHPCADIPIMDGEDYIYSYTTLGNECIDISVFGGTPSFALSVFEDCPDDAESCLGAAFPDNGVTTLESVFFEDAGTYFIVVDDGGACNNFNIEITQSSCAEVLPAAPSCEDAVSLNGCDNQPSIINISQVPDPDPIWLTDVNEGCWGGAGQGNFTWFIFQAQADGDYGFLATNGGIYEDSDIDINVWGPIDTEDQICNFMLTNAPARSTYAADNFDPTQFDLTGLTNTNPNDGTIVNDECETAGGDGFVSTLPVEEGKWYLTVINDFSGEIEFGGISMDFTGTSQGILEPLAENLAITNDTTTCPDTPVQLLAEGGAGYNWFPTTGLSCTDCPNPMATISESTTYQVSIINACSTDTLSVNVAFLTVEAPDDQTICQGQMLELNSQSNLQNITWTWNDPNGVLSCTDCPNPILNSMMSGPGQFEFSVQVSGPGCTASDIVNITVLAEMAPEYEIADNTTICLGESLDLGGPAGSSTSYSWTSNPVGFTSDQANPNVTPESGTTTYYLEASNTECPNPIIDSVSITALTFPILPVLADNVICNGEALTLSGNMEEPGVTYTWSPMEGVSDPSSLNTTFNPNITTTYTLRANIGACAVETTFTLEVGGIALPTISDDVSICLGESVDLGGATVQGVTYIWTSNPVGFISNEANPSTTPPSTTTYYLSISNEECPNPLVDSVTVTVFPIPTLSAFDDATICNGEELTLSGNVEEPDVQYSWSPTDGIQNPNSINTTFSPSSNTTYTLTASAGPCSSETSFSISIGGIPDFNIATNTTICDGDNIELGGAAIQEVTYNWTSNPVGFTSDESNPSINPDQTTTYYLAVSNAECPNPIIDSVRVEVIALPTLPELEDALICPQMELPLSNYAEEPGVTYTWSPSTGVLDPSDLNTEFGPTETTTYTLTASQGACESTSSFTINVSLEPDIMISEDFTICNGTMATLSANASESGTFTWQPIDETGDEITLDDLTETTTYTVAFVDENGCDFPERMVTVEVVDGVNISAISFDPEESIYQGTEVTLNVETDPSTGIVYEWSTGETTPDIIVQPLELPTVSYGITVTDDLGCEDEQQITLDILEPEYAIPNAFTPDGDGVNDYFQVVVQGRNINVINARFYNRWGQLVHEGSGVNHRWSGFHKDKMAPSDVYLYQITVQLPDGKEIVEQGELTLIR